jgi:xanthosine utilization system XapX-like protein
MTLNMDFFGYGAGFVLLGFACGLSVGFVFSIIRRLSSVA